MTLFLQVVLLHLRVEEIHNLGQHIFLLNRQLARHQIVEHVLQLPNELLDQLVRHILERQRRHGDDGLAHAAAAAKTCLTWASRSALRKGFMMLAVAPGTPMESMPMRFMTAPVLPEATMMGRSGNLSLT